MKKTKKTNMGNIYFELFFLSLEVFLITNITSLINSHDIIPNINATNTYNGINQGSDNILFIVLINMVLFF